MSMEILDREEEERRKHIWQWAGFMITHLEGSDEGRHLPYTDSLERLCELLQAELARVREGRSLVATNP